LAVRRWSGGVAERVGEAFDEGAGDFHQIGLAIGQAKSL